MKKYILALLLFLFSVSCKAAVVTDTSKHVLIDTQKVVHISGVVDADMAFNVGLDLAKVSMLPGPILVIIDSPGGDVGVGMRILAMLQEQQALGNKLICVADQVTASMAFNIMSYCDARVSTYHTLFVAHKIAVNPGPETRLTAKVLRELAQEMEEADEQFCVQNAKAMHLSRKQYDKIADEERRWIPYELLRIGYLDGVVEISETL